MSHLVSAESKSVLGARGPMENAAGSDAPGGVFRGYAHGRHDPSVVPASKRAFKALLPKQKP